MQKSSGAKAGLLAPAFARGFDHERKIVMTILWTILIGLLVGIVAKALMPGRDPGGVYYHGADRYRWRVHRASNRPLDGLVHRRTSGWFPRLSWRRNYPAGPLPNGLWPQIGSHLNKLTSNLEHKATSETGSLFCLLPHQKLDRKCPDFAVPHTFRKRAKMLSLQFQRGSHRRPSHFRRSD
jgi:hypothetical protein